MKLEHAMLPLSPVAVALTGCFDPGTMGSDEASGSSVGSPESSASSGGDKPTATSTTSPAPESTGEVDDGTSSGGVVEGSESSTSGADESSTGAPEVLPDSCAAVVSDQPSAPDGIYSIDVDGPGGLEPFEAHCDMTTEGGGWTLIALNDQTTTFDFFDRSWSEYADGFGNLEQQQRGWLGNYRLAQLTAAGLELDVRHNHGSNRYAEFSVADEADLFRLTVVGIALSNDGEHLAIGHSGEPFSTWDQDNDSSPDNCAQSRNAGWWYRACFSVSIASGERQVYWRPPPPNDGAPLWVDWIELWVR